MERGQDNDIPRKQKRGMENENKNRVHDNLCILLSSSGSAAAEEMKDAHKPNQHRHQEYTRPKNPIAKTETSVIQAESSTKSIANPVMANQVKEASAPTLRILFGFMEAPMAKSSML